MDMADLRPEAWMFEDEPHEKSLAGLSKRRKQPVTDILLLVQRLRHKHRVLPMHLMAYVATIIRCHKKLEGLGWVVDDSAY